MKRIFYPIILISALMFLWVNVPSFMATAPAASYAEESLAPSGSVESKESPALIDEGFIKYVNLHFTTFWKPRTVGNAMVYKNFLVYVLDNATGMLIPQENHWQAGVPEKLPEVMITQKQAGEMAPGTVNSAELYIFPSESNVFSISPVSGNPYWIVYSALGGSTVVTVIDAVTGKMMEEGIPSPEYDGMSNDINCVGSCGPYSADWKNALSDCLNNKGYSEQQASAYANAAYPQCGENNCMRPEGDLSLGATPPVGEESPMDVVSYCIINPPTATVPGNTLRYFGLTCYRVSDGGVMTCPGMTWTTTVGTMQNPSNTGATLHAQAFTGTGIVKATHSQNPSIYCKADPVSITGIPLPVADFSADHTTVLVNSPVTFTDLSSGNPDYWHWEFGDDQTSNVQNPVHSYGSADTYSVYLEVGNGAGYDHITKTNYITVATELQRTCTMSPSTASVTRGTIQPYTLACQEGGQNTNCWATNWYTDISGGWMDPAISPANSTLHVPAGAATGPGYHVTASYSNPDPLKAYSCSANVTVVPQQIACTLNPNGGGVDPGGTMPFYVSCTRGGESTACSPQTNWTTTIGTMQFQYSAYQNTFIGGQTQGEGTMTVSYTGATSYDSYACYANVYVGAPQDDCSDGNCPHGYCFSGDTLITLADGSEKPISAIKQGNMVLAYDLKNKKQVEAKVSDIHARTVPTYYLLNGTIRVSPEHPFYVKGKWVKAKNLKVNHKLLNVQGKEVAVTSIKRIEERLEVYNLTVDSVNTFYAGGILVHNKHSYDISVPRGEDY